MPFDDRSEKCDATASTSRTYRHIVASDSPQEVMATPPLVCTSICTSQIESKSESRAQFAGNSEDFARALALIAALPLSVASKAEAVRRLLGIE